MIVRRNNHKIHRVNSLPNLLTTLPILLLLSLLFSTTSIAQSLKIKLIDASSGEPLIGAYVYTPDVSFSTETDLDGRAVLENLGYRDEVIFSYIGYADLKLPIFEIRRRNGIIQMFPDATADTIVVIGRRDDAVEEIPYQVEQIKKADISFKNAQTSADALEVNGGVFIQKTQMGGGSPVIRGFEANRVLNVIDGVRLNNAIYRNGHLQNAVTIDNSMLKQIEVIYGPGSLMYGSDALGGVIHFRSIDPTLLTDASEKDHRLTTNFYTRFATANLEKRAHLDLNYGKQKWGFITSITATDYDALRAGKNGPKEFPNFGKRYFYTDRDQTEAIDQVYSNNFPEIQVGVGTGDPNIYRFWNTEYSQFDFLQKIKVQPNHKVNFTLNYQYSSSTNVPRYDNLLDTIDRADNLKWSEWYYGPQMRSMVSLKTRLLNENVAYDKATIIGSFQRIDEDRIRRKYANRYRTINKEDVFVYSLTADFDKYLDEQERSVISYGLDLAHNRVESKVRVLDINSGRVLLNTATTRYPSGGSAMATFGSYLNYRWRSQDSTIVFNGGLRYSSVNLDATYLETDFIEWPEDYYNQIENNNGDLTWAAGLTWNNASNWQVRVLAAKAFRSPNIDDWAKNRVKGSKIVVPNLDLKPETANNFELTVAKELGDYNARAKQGRFIKLSATGFYSHLKDAIVRVDSSNLDTNVLIVDDEPHDIQININSEDANIFGFSGNVLVKLDDVWTFNSGINITKGTTLFSNNIVQDTIVPFAHIPPLYGATSLRYNYDRLQLELSLKYNGRKKLEDYSVSDIEEGGIIDRGGTSDNIEQTPLDYDAEGKAFHTGTYGWTTVNFYSSYKLNDKYSVNFAIENIFDKLYLPFASTIPAPGRNFVFSLHGKF